MLLLGNVRHFVDLASILPKEPPIATRVTAGILAVLDVLCVAL